MFQVNSLHQGLCDFFFQGYYRDTQILYQWQKVLNIVEMSSFTQYLLKAASHF